MQRMEFKQKSAHLPRSAEDKEKWQRAIIILEHCPLQGVQTNEGFELLNERHRNHHAKYKQDPAEWRPDVVHQCLLHLQDSPLNRAGRLQVFIRTKKGVCIAVDPRLRVPRHMRLFGKMMVGLLYKMKVRASVGYLSLLRVVKNPITDHIPPNTRIFRVEKDGEAVEPFAFCASLTGQMAGASEKTATSSLPQQSAADALEAALATSTAEAGSKTFAAAHHAESVARQFKPFAFVIGGMSKGDVDVDYATDSIRIGDRGKSAAAVISTLLHGLEEAWLGEDNHAE